MRCHQIMTKDFVVCTPTRHLCDLQAQWRPNHRFAVVMDDGKAIGAIPSAAITQTQIDRFDPMCIAKNALLAVSHCSEQDSLGAVGAKILREGTYAAIACHDETPLGVAALLDVLQALLWAESITMDISAHV